MSSSLEKIKQYCAYQERCHSEVRSKLLSMKIYGEELENIIVELIADEFLNEERFAKQYARGKFYQKNWGKIKIKYELKSKGISAYLIQNALSQIDDEDYEKTLFKLATQKLIILKKSNNRFAKMNAIKNYLQQKGYESHLIMKVIQEII
ncbi:MAG: RecX family transcriptional regulator [Chitinophagaceae bacterium]|nr:RecX family transcriptional regulator [Chitinophagaceae bacterium]HMN32520.1 regulatory protein RecX [Chitinophagaceae bacterium]